MARASRPAAATSPISRPASRRLRALGFRGSLVLPYWLLFAFFAAGAMLGSRAWYAQTADGRLHQPAPRNAAYLFGGLMISLVIGLRYQVGGDWFAYQRM